MIWQWTRRIGIMLVASAVLVLGVDRIGARAQAPDAVILAGLQGNAKLLHADDILAAFSAGEPETAVIVTLQPSAVANGLAAQSRLSAQVPAEVNTPGAPTFYNLRDRTIRTQLRTTVTETVAMAIDRLAGDGVRITQRFSYQFGFAAQVTPAALQRIVADPEVIAVEKDRILKAHLAQGIPLMNAAIPRATYTGSGLSIAICDTGIDTSHPRLGGGGFPNSKVIGGFDTGDSDADPRPDSLDGEAHGTACAGIAAGNTGTVGDYIGGVAPGAKLYAVKISTGNTGSAFESAMIAGWEWCVTHQDDDPANPIMIISTSFGGGKFFATCDGDSPSMTAAAANAVAAGITIFASSGNDGYCDAMGWPACISYVNSVGAVYDASMGTYGFCVDATSCATKEANLGCTTTGYAAWDITAADKVTSYSNSASFLTLFAPSNDAYTTDIVGAGGYSTGDYDAGFGGTSAACPYAAGAAAVLQSAAKNKYGTFLAPAEVKQYLVNNGDSVTDGKVAVTKPRLNLDKAVKALLPVLTVTKIGKGTVTSSPTGINCGSDCTQTYALDTPVTLTATTDPGAPFVGWSGEGCSGTGPCAVTMDQNRNVTASFYTFPWFMFLPAITARGAVPPPPATYWSALSLVYCTDSVATFSLTAEGITKNSVMPAGGGSGGSGTFAGWVTTAPGAKAFSWQLNASTCGSWTGRFSSTLRDNKNYMYVLDVANSQLTISVSVADGKPSAAANGTAAYDSAKAAAEAKASMRLVERIPLAVPKGIFAGSVLNIPQ